MALFIDVDGENFSVREIKSKKVLFTGTWRECLDFWLEKNLDYDDTVQEQSASKS